MKDPEETVHHLNDLLSGKFEGAERIHNAYLKGIVTKLGKNPSSKDFQMAIKQFLADYEKQIQRDYEGGDESVRTEIEEIYSEFSKVPKN